MTETEVIPRDKRRGKLRNSMRNGRCRLHGGLSTGPKTNEGLERIRQAAMKHGRYSQQAKTEQRHYQELLRSLRAFLNEPLDHRRHGACLKAQQPFL